ncbi:MAG: 2-oxoglutarate dehydrogenase E1 component [Rhodospirillales bacterium]|nr:2-oxoglutarate dehydrogenase E1 component [Rhodospirillales bacterium]
MTATDPLSVFYAGNQSYVADLYRRYLENPQSVDPRWQETFAGFDDEAQALIAEMRGPSWAPTKPFPGGNGAAAAETVEHAETAPAAAPAPQGPRFAADRGRDAVRDSLQAFTMIRSYRVRGHLLAELDPLGLWAREDHPELDPATYGFTERDMDREIFLNFVLGLESATMREIVRVLRETYCGHIGVEYMHIQGPEEKAWIQERVEPARNKPQFTDKSKRGILERLIETEAFESYLDKKFTGTKRFGLDGGESVIPAMEQIFKRGSQLGLQEVVIGMAHRGRLNILANVMNKPFQAIFAEFQGTPAKPDDVQGSGDVKYHLGTSVDRVFDGRSVHLSLTANPSHLEVVNTVVLGKVRAKQRQKNDAQREKVMGMLLHGDAAFAGQGLVPEALELSNLAGYETGGTIHIVINNQIGFTTSPQYSRSSIYCTDIAKAVSAPIFHVNADDPEAVAHSARMAMEYRQRFKSDVVLDIVCYRRYGHNESDEPAFTQPRMYRKIAEHPTTSTLYADRLVAEGTITQAYADAARATTAKRLDDAFDAAKGYKVNKADWLEGSWAGFTVAYGDARRGETGVPIERLKEVGLAIARVPENVNVHKKIVRQLETKRKMIETGEGIDWATGEALAFGTLAVDGHPVRLSGQDCGRGTFSQRHSVLIDQDTEERYVPLNNIRFGQAPYEVIDSPLSEAGVLGFEYGYSLAEPQMLVLWEGQFGDFANGAQVVIDQFIAAGESKWLRMSGLVLLLPHGYEGQGPEHSSARLERYLQLCAEDNMQVCNCTTPASYFHALRRQLMRDFRKPLIMMTPKSLLRHKLAVSRLSEMAAGETFHRVLWDRGDVLADARIKRVVLCSGKVYYDLYEEREKRGQKDAYVLRLEQLYPFPKKALTEELGRFPNADIVWCQEEPKNMGAWTMIREPLEETLSEMGRGGETVRYTGRAAAASPATGSHKKHVAEQAALVNDALTIQQTGAKAPPKAAKRR